MDRRTFLKWTGRGVAVAALGTVAVKLGKPAPVARPIWQINPDLCIQCGKCETACVRKPSAVKCLNDEALCDHCYACHGHVHTSKDKSCDPLQDEPVCPYDAVERAPIGRSQRSFTYKINHDKCLACAKCVDRCSALGKESMFLAILPTLCHGCNECAIAKVCPADAIHRIPSTPTLEKRPVPADPDKPVECIPAPPAKPNPEDQS